MITIPTTYIDVIGVVETAIVNDGEILTLDIDGEKLSGYSFDDFKLVEGESKRLRFNNYGELTYCRLICRVPLMLQRPNEIGEFILEVDIALDSTPEVGHGFEAVFSTVLAGKQYTTNTVTEFEGGLGALQKSLPEDHKLRCCYGCQYADYNVAGSARFGSMICYKKFKQEYLKASNKDEYMDVQAKCSRTVQETFLCEEFEVRMPGVGYRG